ncbi:hypothetical protein SAMN05444157_3272 [Frankineae bacterium MT45]|nr:hypothetical protein SAMN05444157_3272 [Frankineae bacterium MT45]
MPYELNIGHRTYQCRAAVDGVECGQWMYAPPHTG